MLCITVLQVDGFATCVLHAPMAKTVHFSMRMAEDLKVVLDQYAAAENRKVANLVETVLKKYAADRQAERADAKRASVRR